MTYTRERLDTRNLDTATDHGSFDCDLNGSDRKAVHEARGSMHPPSAMWTLILWGTLVVGLMAGATWSLWWPVLVWW